VNAQKPDILFVDAHSKYFDIRTFIRDLEVSNGMQVIGLIRLATPEKITGLFRWALHTDECKYDLLENLKSILGKRLMSEKSENSQKELSEREKTILAEIVLGLTNQEIADKLFLSIHTVTTHRKNLTNKLGIKTVSGLTVYALLNKLVDIRDIEHR
jgi:DNA-binding CsgD family transcriptional regulator